MTVAELIEALQKLDPTLSVDNEGCDCYVPSGQPKEYENTWPVTERRVVITNGGA